MGNVMNESHFIEQIMTLLPTLMRTAAAMVGIADAEDAVQETLIRAWQSWHTYRTTDPLRPWILRIEVNLCCNWQRGRFGTRQKTTIMFSTIDVLPLIDPTTDLGGSDHTGALDLHVALTHLDYSSHQIILLRYYAGLDATEIGHALNTPPATIRTRLRRALLALRAELDNTKTTPEAKGDV
jgi:RNA polymerase sigma-70 factor (ECF subfamily)